MKQSVKKVQMLPEFKELIAEIRTSKSIKNLGLGRAVRLPILSALQESLQRPILLITERTNWGLTLMDELGMWHTSAQLLFFPEPTSLYYENISWGENSRRDRVLALTKLGVSEPNYSTLVIAPVRAVMTKSLSKKEFYGATISIHLGLKIDPIKLISKLVGNSYESVSTVTSPGQFARRGGIIDLWPPAEILPTRLDFFGDEIDTLRNFDPSTQIGANSQEELLITPAREFLIGREPQENLDGKALNEFDIPRLHTEPSCLIDYLPNNALVVVEDWQSLRQTMEEIEEQSVGFRNDAITEGIIESDFPAPYLSFGELIDFLTPYQSIELGPIANPQGSDLSSMFSSGQRFGGKLKPLLEHIQICNEHGDEVLIVSRQAARLQELWNETTYGQLQDGVIRFVEGSLTEGWILTPKNGVRHHVLSDGEIFGWQRPQPRIRPRIAPESPESDFSDFQINELVVHIDHGIGRFKGLVDRAVEEVEHEYLSVEYADGDQLYVPVHQADRLTKYVGDKGNAPAINRLGGVEWRRVKSRVHKAVQEIAEGLLELYAKRQVVDGFAFGPDTPWQEELEASFPFIETNDQLRVISDVKQDMESRKSMDRLVCGDVGYGKTEVALRAAFKAVMDGKQVSILVPTTILAQQHYRTFKHRLAAYPIEVEMLSRFRTRKQQMNILQGLAEGTLDIVIGTHRLVQGDVKFKDLGLLIVDEEQRFGVVHKEHLKKMRAQVDVLTMTATPIPRTLYMALTGVRDISTINTAPEERLPVVTHVGGYSPQLVRKAIIRELERGGQVFFVHNRVRTIQAVHNRLSRVVPEASIKIVHGQMSEVTLATRMREFTRGEIDVLLTTSIIESGLDIPNANTIIVDRADTFGLSQLYQLRGRVGRGAQRAYAYFFQHRRKPPTEEGKLRLETIAENSQLGAGYSIAMRDLEIRGTGDILGTRQHGYIESVGFHLYTRLLNQAVSHIREKGISSPDSTQASKGIFQPHINIDLPLTISIPKSYVLDKKMRLSLYRRIAELETNDEVDKVKKEFEDRFGDLPAVVTNLFYQLKVKLLSEKAGLESITVENNQIALRYPSISNGSPERQYPPLGREIRTSKNKVWMPIKSTNQWQNNLIELLEILSIKNLGN